MFGSWSLVRKADSHRAPIAPSTTLWSQLRVTLMTLAVRWLEERGEEREKEGVFNWEKQVVSQ